MNDKSKIHTYHCLCSTFLLATPYTLTSLPRRALPSLDRAHILPLPALSRSIQPAPAPAPFTGENGNEGDLISVDKGGEEVQDGTTKSNEAHFPSLLAPSLRPARKLIIVRREDGFERRRVYRCGRCGLTIGYEMETETAPTGAVGKGVEGKVIYLLEGGLVATEDMGKEEG